MKLSDISLHDVGHSIQLAGSIWTGNGKAYLCMFPEDAGYPRASLDAGHFEDHHKPVLVQDGKELDLVSLDMESADWETFLRQTDLLETEILAKASDGTLAKVIVRKSQRQIEAGISWKVFKRDGYACRYCGKDDLPLTVDHLVLWEVGGPSIEANLLSACKKCNKTRGRLPYEEWLKNSYYVRVSASLTEVQRAANLAVASTLKNIPVNVNQRTR